ncbi:MAG: ribonuclease Y [Bdellovibrio sp.]
MEIIVASIVGLLLGAVLSFTIKKMKDEAQKKSARQEADRILNRAKAEAARIEKDSKARAKDFESRARRNVEQDIQKLKNQLKSRESQLEKKLKDLDEVALARKEEADRLTAELKGKETLLQSSVNRQKESEKRLELQAQELTQKLERVSHMTVEQARRELIEALESEAKQEANRRIVGIEKEAEQEAERRDRRILASSVSRLASEYTSERTVSVMALTSEEMKGKIIGREGRNIRTLEALCGVDLIVDDTPEAVVISGFDPLRRELAKKTIEKLMEDGRVHPARIEEVVEKMRVELAKSVREEGEKAAVELGVSGIHNEIVKVLGSLKYRHTHTQNLLNHSLEVAYLAGVMAAEMGENIKLARRAGLLHDIGKAIEHTVDGNHAVVGADFLKKYGESEAIVHAVRAHHNDEPPNSVIAHLVQAANILSNSRPGARRPGMDHFIQRLQEIESVANSFDGVIRSYALQAGREVRVIVEASKVTDDLSQMMARDIVRKIEREMPHLGQLRVAVVRETRSVEVAR